MVWLRGVMSSTVNSHLTTLVSLTHVVCAILKNSMALTVKAACLFLWAGWER